MCSPQSTLPQTLVPDSLENSLSYSVLNYLKRLKNQAKIEYDRLCNEVSNKQPPLGSKSSVVSSNVNEGIRVISRSGLKRDLISHPLLQGQFIYYKSVSKSIGQFRIVVRSQLYIKFIQLLYYIRCLKKDKLIPKLTVMKETT